MADKGASAIRTAFRVLLAKHNMTYEQVAELMGDGCTKQHVYRWMAGNADVGFTVIQRMADAFGMKPSEVVALGE